MGCQCASLLGLMKSFKRRLVMHKGKNNAQYCQLGEACMPGGSNPRRTNGHRRDQVRARVLGRGATCWICGMPIDLSEPHMSPLQGVVDELVPVSRGGSPYDLSNCAPAHRCCNGWRGAKPVAVVRDVQYLVAMIGGASSPQQWCRIARSAIRDLRRGSRSVQQPSTSTDW